MLCFSAGDCTCLRNCRKLKWVVGVWLRYVKSLMSYCSISMQSWNPREEQHVILKSVCRTFGRSGKGFAKTYRCNIVSHQVTPIKYRDLIKSANVFLSSLLHWLNIKTVSWFWCLQCHVVDFEVRIVPRAGHVSLIYLTEYRNVKLDADMLSSRRPKWLSRCWRSLFNFSLSHFCINLIKLLWHLVWWVISILIIRWEHSYLFTVLMMAMKFVFGTESSKGLCLSLMISCSVSVPREIFLFALEQRRKGRVRAESTLKNIHRQVKTREAKIIFINYASRFGIFWLMLIVRNDSASSFFVHEFDVLVSEDREK